jgi:hypothetical protein
MGVCAGFQLNRWAPEVAACCRRGEVERGYSVSIVQARGERARPLSLDQREGLPRGSWNFVGGALGMRYSRSIVSKAVVGE